MPPDPADRAQGPGPARALSRVAVALDTDDRGELLAWCELFGPRVGALKVGLEAFVRWGPAVVEEVRRHTPAVFLDLKLHDIPNTVAGAVRSARELGVRYLTVHASGGPAMVQAAAEAAEGVAILAVTVLTHLDAAALERLELPGSAGHRVQAWASVARSAGATGVVCSPLETADLRDRHPRPFLLVTPGIRPGDSPRDDQRRTANPARALADGADLLVVGRPLTRAPDPEAALRHLAREMGPEPPGSGGAGGAADQNQK